MKDGDDSQVSQQVLAAQYCTALRFWGSVLFLTFIKLGLGFLLNVFFGGVGGGGGDWVRLEHLGFG